MLLALLLASAAVYVLYSLARPIGPCRVCARRRGDTDRWDCHRCRGTGQQIRPGHRAVKYLTDTHHRSRRHPNTHRE